MARFAPLLIPAGGLAIGQSYLVDGTPRWVLVVVGILFIGVGSYVLGLSKRGEQ